MSGTKYTAAAWAEVRVNCYKGENCDEHENYWNSFWEGDKQDDDHEDPIVLDAKTLPPGTKVTIEFPLCPKCYMSQECCNCGFDWHNWAEEEFS